MPLPDHDQVYSEVARLRDEAKLRLRNSTADAPTPVEFPKEQPQGVIAPIYMGKDHEVVPERYVIHYEFVQCKNCGAATRASEFYALTYLRSRVNGTRVRHLTKCPRALYNIPVEKILTGCSTIPYCQECDRIDLSHLPPPPVSTNLYDLAEPRLKGAPVKPKAEPKPPVKKPTLDDLV